MRPTIKTFFVEGIEKKVDVNFNVTKVIKIVEVVLKKILNVGKLTEEGSNWLLFKCF